MYMRLPALAAAEDVSKFSKNPRIVAGSSDPYNRIIYISKYDLSLVRSLMTVLV